MPVLWNRLIGFMVIFIGISIGVNIIGFGNQFLGALFLFGIGVILYKYAHRWIGIFTLALAVITLFTNVFHINIAGAMVAAVFIYIGYCFLTGKEVPFLKTARRREKREKRSRREKKRRKRHKRYRRTTDEEDDIDTDWLDDEIDALQEEHERKKRTNEENERKNRSNREYDDPADVRLKAPKFRSSVMGDLHLRNHRFELEDMNLASGIGDVKIDLSKAIIPEGESTIAISGLIGDVDIYVPYDLDVAVAGSVTLGELKVLGHKQGGFNRQINMATRSYEQAERKVKISVSIFIGDIDVRHL